MGLQIGRPISKLLIIINLLGEVQVFFQFDLRGDQVGRFDDLIFLFGVQDDQDVDSHFQIRHLGTTGKTPPGN